MSNFISVHNVPVSLEERICFNKTKCTVYVNPYSWIVDIDGFYEFYYTPNHFIGKISHSQMPNKVVNRIIQSYKVIKGEDIGYGQTKACLRTTSIRFRNLEHDLQIGTWYHAQGQNYATFGNLFVCDDMYVSDCERACSFFEIDGCLIHDMLRMGCQTRTPHYYRGIFDFPCFQGIECNNIIVYPFDGMGWDADQWASEFKALSKAVRDYKSRSAADDIRTMRAEVFMHTVNVVKQGYYDTGSGERIEIPDDSELIRNTRFYKEEIPLVDSNRRFATEISVENIDCLLAAKRLQDEGFNVVVLNMASRQNPGGGVYGGAGAQEENLFRRSNLFRSMFQFAPYASQYGVHKSSCQYPLDRNFGGVYTPNALVFRDTEDNGYKLLGTPYCVSFIAVPAINRPELDADGMIAESLVEPVKNKMRTIFRIGFLHGHDALVLGALGCGAFRNPPRHVARLFHEILEEPEFKNIYRKIVFAILDDHNAYKEHNPEGNFKPFTEEFAKTV